MESALEKHVQEREMIHRAVNTDLESLKCLEHILEKRKEVARMYLTSTNEDNQKELFNIISYLNDQIKAVVF